MRDAAPDFNSSAYREHIRAAVSSQHGRESFYGFPSFAIFSALVREVVRRFDAPAERCVALVKARVVAMARAVAEEHFAHQFPPLKALADRLVKALSDELHASAREMVARLFEMQLQPFTQSMSACYSSCLSENASSAHAGGGDGELGAAPWAGGGDDACCVASTERGQETWRAPKRRSGNGRDDDAAEYEARGAARWRAHAMSGARRPGGFPPSGLLSSERTLLDSDRPPASPPARA